MTRMVRTRFAPSPTGFLHIGGVRTALYNWLFARRHGGQFILRIDDTDAERNVAEALAPILHGFKWLGITWDEGPEVDGSHGPYYQSQKRERYQAAVRQLLDKGLAYWDYATPEELKAEREAAEKAKQSWVYSRRWMAQDEADRRRFEGEGRRGVVRLKMPREGACEFTDHVRGDMRVGWATEQDHVIQRADGSCLYNLASVVDDFDMKITHVIRAQEHLSNTPRQIFIADGLGYDRPEHVHLPFVAEPGSLNKLSKRKLKNYLEKPDFKAVHEKGLAIARAIGLTTSDDTFNPVIVDFYEQVGYLPEAILNYMLLVGWSLDDKTEMFGRDEMVREFSLERVNKAPASFDVKKLAAFQERYMTALPMGRKLEMCLPYLEKAHIIPSPPDDATREQVRRVLEAAAHRIVIAGDILDYAYFFVPDERFDFDEKAVDKHLVKPAGAKDWLKALDQQLADLSPFNAPSIECVVRNFVEEGELRLGDVSQALRVATTGRAAGFGTFETLALLGKERVLSRLRRAQTM
jgi:glutamyl-tRNA synthetase